MPDLSDLKPYIFGPATIAYRVIYGHVCNSEAPFVLGAVSKDGVTVRFTRDKHDFIDAYFRSPLDVGYLAPTGELEFNAVLMDSGFLNVLNNFIFGIQHKVARYSDSVLQLKIESDKNIAIFHFVVPVEVSLSLGVKYTEIAFKAGLLIPHWCDIYYPFTIESKE